MDLGRPGETALVLGGTRGLASALVQVKAPSESKYPWDYYKVLATIPGDEAFQPLSKSTCALISKK